jgi:hypothetical protein
MLLENLRVHHNRLIALKRSSNERMRDSLSVLFVRDHIRTFERADLNIEGGRKGLKSL